MWKFDDLLLKAIRISVWNSCGWVVEYVNAEN